MNRFYELLAAGKEPAEALRVAQLWLRDLSDGEEQAYLVTRPTLRAKQAEQETTAANPSPLPYSDITLWGAFVFTGA
jgi:CHAT domain-containing protein